MTYSQFLNQKVEFQKSLNAFIVETVLLVDFCSGVLKKYNNSFIWSALEIEVGLIQTNSWKTHVIVFINNLTIYSSKEREMDNRKHESYLWKSSQIPHVWCLVGILILIVSSLSPFAQLELVWKPAMLNGGDSPTQSSQENIDCNWTLRSPWGVLSGNGEPWENFEKGPT